MNEWVNKIALSPRLSNVQMQYNCHPYFHVLSAFENQNNLTADTLHMQYILT